MNPIEQRIRAAVEGVIEDIEKEKEASIPSLADQQKALDAYIKPHTLKVGDHVKRNTTGHSRYNFPKSDDQVVVVSDVFERPMIDEKGEVINGEVAIAICHKSAVKILVFTVDLRCYEKIQEGSAVN